MEMSEDVKTEDFCIECSRGNYCEVGVALKRDVQMTSDLHVLDNNEARRRKRVKAMRAWQFHVDGKYEQVNIVIPENTG